MFDSVSCYWYHLYPVEEGECGGREGYGRMWGRLDVVWGKRGIWEVGCSVGLVGKLLDPPETERVHRERR